MTEISIVLPIHNEEKLLPYSLRSLGKCPVDEIIFLLDRCTDNSEDLINEFAGWRKDIFIIECNESTWINPIAEAFECAFKHTTHDLIYTMASDIITDPLIYNPKLFGESDIVSFQYSNHTPNKFSLHENYVNLLGGLPLTYRCKYGKWSGHFAMKRRVWETLHFNDVGSPDLNFFNRAFDHGFKHRFMKSKTQHLRPGLRRDKQIEQATYRFQTKANPIKVFAHSVLTLKPYLLAQYLKHKTA